MAQQGKFDLRILKRLLRFAKPYRKLLIIAFCCTFLLAIVSPVRPKVIGYMINKLAIEDGNATLFFQFALFVAGMLLLEALLQFGSTYFTNLMAQSVVRDIRVKLFEHISTFRMQFFDKSPVGGLVTRVVSDIEAISETFSSGIVDILGDMLMLFFILLLMFADDWQLAIVSIIPIPILIFATRIFAKSMRRAFQKEGSAVTRLNTFVQENITGMNIVQLFGKEKKTYEDFVEVNKSHRQAHIDAVWAFSIFFPIVDFLSSLSLSLLIVWAAFSVTGNLTEDSANFGKIFAFTMWVQMMFRPIRMLADKFNILQRGIVRADKVFELIDTEDSVQNRGHLTDVNFDQRLEFRDVYFAYKEEDWVLKGIHLTIEPRQTIAFVGATGAGKSSIVNLLGRFYEYQKGEIYIGSNELRHIELEYLRKNIAVVLQDVFLFSDSIHNNITLGNEQITREQVVAAAKAVGAHDFIAKLPGNYDYQVGERGGVLSVGQRQLLSFIRAYVYNPHILILDEATSSVDSESERLIQEATEKLTQGRTSIVIAHRLSTIHAADKIIVLDKGEIKEIGSHHELLQKNGYYHKLYSMQYA